MSESAKRLKQVGRQASDAAPMKPSPSCQDQVLYEGETGIMSAGSRASFGGCVSVLVVDKHETVAVLADMPNRVPGGTVPFYGGGFRLFPFAGMRPLTALFEVVCVRHSATSF